MRVWTYQEELEWSNGRLGEVVYVDELDARFAIIYWLNPSIPRPGRFFVAYRDENDTRDGGWTDCFKEHNGWDTLPSAIVQLRVARDHFKQKGELNV